MSLSPKQLTTRQLASIRENKWEEKKEPKVCQHSLVLPCSPLSLSSRLDRMVEWLWWSSYGATWHLVELRHCLPGCGICSKSAFNILSYFSQIWEQKGGNGTGFSSYYLQRSISKSAASHSHDFGLCWFQGLSSIGRNASFRWNNNDSIQMKLRLHLATLGSFYHWINKMESISRYWLWWLILITEGKLSCYYTIGVEWSMSTTQEIL